MFACMREVVPQSTQRSFLVDLVVSRVFDTTFGQEFCFSLTLPLQIINPVLLPSNREGYYCSKTGSDSRLGNSMPYTQVLNSVRYSRFVQISTDDPLQMRMRATLLARGMSEADVKEYFIQEALKQQLQQSGSQPASPKTTAVGKSKEKKKKKDKVS